MQGTTADRLARHLVRAMGPALRKHGGEAPMDRDLIAELYVGILDVLSEEGDALCGGGGVPAGVTDRLALTAYLIIATHSAAENVVPALLESLRCEIRAATLPIVSDEVNTLPDDAAQLTKGDSQDAA